jgi:hypothetical protein
MKEKDKIIQGIKDIYHRWEVLLASLDEEQIIRQDSLSEMSIKDVIVHLYTWQQLSIARLEAALSGSEPVDLGWPAGLDPESDVDKINAWIYEENHHRPWQNIAVDWKEGYLRFIELAEEIPEKDLLAAGRYAWIGGHPLILVLQGSYEHHREHLEQLVG